MKNPQPLSPFFQAALSVARVTPLGRGRMRKFALNVLRRHVDYPIITDFRGVPFILNLDNTTESKALFGHYDLEELAFLKKNASHSNAVFVDIGANSGFFTQNYLGMDNHGLVLAIEPNPAMCDRIKGNFALLQKTYPDRQYNLILECCAVGDQKGEMTLDLSLGFGGAHITDKPVAKSITVKIEPLTDILARHNITHIDVLKIDVEGYEDKALLPFFATAPASLLPRHIIIEYTSSRKWSGDLSSVLEKNGYVTVKETRGNLLLTRK